MFSNFLYFIVVLLIYATYQPSEAPNFSLFESLFLCILLAALFTLFVRRQIYRLLRRCAAQGWQQLDLQMQATQTRLCILAVLLFAVDVFALSLPSFFSSLTLFRWFPTLQTLLFLALFVGYLSIVWAFTWLPYRLLHPTDLSRRAYVLSNISFSIPVLLPWLLLSAVADLIHIGPFEWPRRALSSTEGEIAYFLIFLVCIAVVGPAMIQRFWRCKPLADSPVRRRIEALCRRAEFTYADIVYWPIFGSHMITAGVMGLIRRFRYVLVTEGLLRSLGSDEINAVVAHEIGHVKNRHLLYYLFFFIGYLVISYASFDLIVFAILYVNPFYRVFGALGLSQTTMLSTVFSFLMIAVFLLYFRFIFGYFMRNFERQADLYVYELFEDAEPLIRTFHKIARSSAESPEKPNWHHFSIAERIGYLEKCEKDPAWIARHHRKVKRSLMVYAAGLFIIAAVGLQLNYGETGRNVSSRFLETILLREIEAQPQNPDLYHLLGDFYYGKNRLSSALKAYRSALSLAPRNPEVLNNLAWLYATSEDPSLRDPDKALAFALQAAALSKTPHILDTLAESYYVNGRFNHAVAAAQEALALNPENRSHYEAQLRKFQAAVRQNKAAGLSGKDP